ncbi:exonuclease [Bailinhaonella thermotolerans]|uniref:Exonuclease n=1 Tax=Bailinhaonella thermotolerans TaxID=1070861 RepID=A0A3A4BFM1_9ACTN|nr:exonuclease [Bailinhaonella thermotolerans]RJL33282.1 exonuclease [Bailinhaonella thermotolerans]
MRAEIYVSADVEADGPIPGPYSMLSFGFAVAGRAEGRRFTAVDPLERTFYAELRPISEEFVPASVAVTGLDRDRLVREGRDPAEAMAEAAAWVASLGGSPVLVAYPLAYDWTWLYWYFERYAPGGSPFGHSRALDIKTLYAAKAGVPVKWATKRQMPRHLQSTRPHTHHALDDAVEQAELFQNLMLWPGPGSP